MPNTRFQALVESRNREHANINETDKRSDLFGKNVFNEDKMHQFLTEEALDKVKSAIFHLQVIQ